MALPVLYLDTLREATSQGRNVTLALSLSKGEDGVRKIELSAGAGEEDEVGGPAAIEIREAIQ